MMLVRSLCPDADVPGGEPPIAALPLKPWRDSELPFIAADYGVKPRRSEMFLLNGQRGIIDTVHMTLQVRTRIKNELDKLEKLGFKERKLRPSYYLNKNGLLVKVFHRRFVLSEVGLVVDVRRRRIRVQASIPKLCFGRNDRQASVTLKMLYEAIQFMTSGLFPEVTELSRQWGERWLLTRLDLVVHAWGDCDQVIDVMRHVRTYRYRGEPHDPNGYGGLYIGRTRNREKTLPSGVTVKVRSGSPGTTFSAYDKGKQQWQDVRWKKSMKRLEEGRVLRFEMRMQQRRSMSWLMARLPDASDGCGVYMRSDADGSVVCKKLDYATLHEILAIELAVMVGSARRPSMRKNARAKRRRNQIRRIVADIETVDDSLLFGAKRKKLQAEVLYWKMAKAKPSINLHHCFWPADLPVKKEYAHPGVYRHRRAKRKARDLTVIKLNDD